MMHNFIDFDVKDKYLITYGKRSSKLKLLDTGVLCGDNSDRAIALVCPITGHTCGSHCAWFDVVVNKQSIVEKEIFVRDTYFCRDKELGRSKKYIIKKEEKKEIF